MPNYVYGTNNSETINFLDGVTIGNDQIFGYDGNDSIFGLAGDDYIVGGTGADALDGGPGSDTASYTTSTAGIMASLSYGVGVGGDAEGDTYFRIENLWGTQYADALVGNDSSNKLAGNGGDDLLDGGDGDDLLWGGSGNDELKGGGGADLLSGGVGIDTVSYYESPEGVIVLLGFEGAGGDAEGDTFGDIENVTGSIYADILWGDDGVNKLMGMDGADVLRGLDGSDTLDGGAGADRMLGGPGGDTYYVDNGADEVIEVAGQGADQVLTSVSYSLAPGSEVEMLGVTDRAATTAISLGGNNYANTIFGNAGVNVIVGGAGLDTMIGGDGGDIFVWHSITEMGSTVDANSDTVGSDFNAAIGDRLVLNLIDADGNAGNGDTAFSFIGTADNPFTAAGQVSWLVGETDTYILLNTDGDAATDGVIRVLGVHAVDASWFVL
jgi:Ca2+-binding RTX toxin-like protein